MSTTFKDSFGAGYSKGFVDGAGAEVKKLSKELEEYKVALQTANERIKEANQYKKQSMARAIALNQQLKHLQEKLQTAYDKIGQLFDARNRGVSAHDTSARDTQERSTPDLVEVVGIVETITVVPCEPPCKRSRE